MARPLLIAGGGLAAQRCCEALRAAGDDRPITILCAEHVRPYDRPPLSKEVDGRDVHFRPESWYAEQAIELRLGVAATGLDPVRREVATGDGGRVPYGDLLVATGALPRSLPLLQGLANVQALRTLGDAARLRAAIAGGGPLAVVGAGLIGLEAAATAARAGAEVTVIEAAPRVLPGVLGPRAAAWLTACHRAAGVRIRTGTTVASVARRGGRAEALVLADGERVPCAHVLAGVGVAPAVGWLRGFRGDPRVHLAGDAAGGGHWEAASRAGAAVAAALLGRPARLAGPASFWSDQHGVRLVCVGDPRDAREQLAAGDLAAGEFELDHVRDGRVAAVLLANRPPSALRAARARLHTTPIPERNAA